MIFGWLKPMTPALLVGILVYALSPGAMLQADAKSKQCRTDAAEHGGKHHRHHGELHVKSISYRKSGGFMGVNRGCDLDLSKMSHDERAKIESLFDVNDFMSLKSSTTPGAADVFYYSLEVVATAGQSHQVKFDDVTLPATLRPLVTYLDGQSQDLRPH